MDPLSITASVAGIISACLSVAHQLNDLRSKFAQAPLVIGSLCTQLTLTTASLSQIQDALYDSDDDSWRRRMSSQVLNAFDTALIGCTVVLSCVEEEIMGLKESTSLNFKQKAGFVWNEATFKELASQLHGQQSAITLLLQAIQMKSAVEVRQLIKNNTAILERIARGTRSLRSSYPALNLPDSTMSRHTSVRERSLVDSASENWATEFEFDDFIVSSHVYRKALQAARRPEGKSRPDDRQSKFIEEDLIDLSAPQDPPEGNNTEGSQTLRDFLDELRCLDSDYVEQGKLEDFNDQQSEGAQKSAETSLNKYPDSPQDTIRQDQSIIDITRSPSITDRSTSNNTNEEPVQSLTQPQASDELLSSATTESAEDATFTKFTVHGDAENVKFKQERSVEAVLAEDCISQSDLSTLAVKAMSMLCKECNKNSTINSHRVCTKCSLIATKDVTEVVKVTELDVHKGITVSEGTLAMSLDRASGLGANLAHYGRAHRVPAVTRLGENFDSLLQGMRSYTNYCATHGGIEASAKMLQITQDFQHLHSDLSRTINDLASRESSNPGFWNNTVQRVAERLQTTTNDLLEKLTKIVPDDFDEAFEQWQILRRQMDHRALQNGQKRWRWRLTNEAT